MRTTCLAAFLLALGFAHTAGAQSLADVANAEAARRASVAKPAKVYTNKDLADPATPEKPPEPPAPPAAPIPAAAEPVEPTPPAARTPATSARRPASAKTPARAAAAPPKDEGYWRNRRRVLETKLGSDIAAGDAARQRHVKLLEQPLEGLTSEQLKTLAADIQKATVELNRWTAAVQKDSTALKALEDEAQRANIPPERLRSSAPPAKAVN